MNLPSGPWGKIGSGALLFALLFLIASALMLNTVLDGYRASRALVLRTNIILQTIDELQSAVRTAESGQRGYLLTGEPRYLAPYERAVERIWPLHQQLVELILDPGQARRAEALRQPLDAKLTELAQTVALRKQGLEPALAVVRTDVGQRLMEEIDIIIADMQEGQARLLEERTAVEETNAVWTGRVATGIVVLALVNGLIGLALLRIQHNRDQLARYNVELERQVTERTARLVEVNQQLDAFAYIISHDLRAPIRAVHGYAEALEEDYGAELPEGAKGFVRRMTAAAGRMNGLIEDLLAYSRIGKADIVLKPISLEQIIDRTLRNLPEHDLASATIRIDRPMPEVIAHAPTLLQATTNLLSNAIKFREPGRPSMVHIWYEKKGPKARLWVADNGVGIDPTHFERIFRPFERLHGVEAYPGTGIGLAIVHRSMARMGGDCGVQSAAGTGARFWIELPLAPAKEALS